MRSVAGACNHPNVPSIPFFLQSSRIIQGGKRRAKWVCRAVLARSLNAYICEPFFSIEANRAAYYGKLSKCRELSQRSVAADQRDSLKAAAAATQAATALWETEYGNLDAGRRGAAAASAMAPGTAAKIFAALTFAELKDGPRAEALASELSRRFPDAPLLNNVWLSTIRARIAISRDNPAEAIKLLQAALPYELGQEPPLPSRIIR